jgi:pimeloyl-ACP methyl ester carboxylesterase
MPSRHGAVVAGATMIVGLSSCGGSSEEKAAVGGSTPGPAAARTVTARVDGRVLSGHCRGERRDEPAVVLDSGSGRQGHLAGLEELLMKRTLVCAYDRAGIGRSDPPAKTPRPVSELVSDLDAFATAADVPAPYALVGELTGGNVVLAYAQTHPEKVAGFVAMNPLPPPKTFLPAVKKVETAKEYAEEKAFFRGGNDERVTFEEPVLGTPIPPSVRYAIVVGNACDNDYCERILPPAIRSTRGLARLGEGGRFVLAEGATFEISRSDPELALKTVDEILTG